MALLLLATVAWCSYWLGRAALRGVGLRFTSTIEDVTWHTGIGLGLAGLLLAGLGLGGLLWKEIVLALTVAGALVGIVQCCLLRRSTTRAPARRARKPLAIVALGLGMAGLLCAAAALVGAMAPPTAGDAMCYHLELPKVFLAQHGLSYLPDSDNSTYPLLMEMLFLWGLALQGGVLAQLMHWLTGVLLGGAAVVLARPILGTAAWAVGAVVLLVPGVTNEMTAPLNDVGLALFTTLGAAAVLKVSRTGWRRWYGVAGLCFGLAVGVKLLAGLFLTAVVVCMLVAPVLGVSERIGGQARARLAAPGLVCLVALLAGSGWYMRAYYHTGNPVYPFLGQWFGSGRDDALPKRKRPLGAGDVLRAPWLLTMHPERFGGRSHQLGALFLALLPGWLLVRHNRPLGWLLAIAGVYAALWYALRQNVRFLMPIVPLLSVSVVAVLLESRQFGRGPRWMIAGCVALLATFSLAIAVHRVRDRVAVVVGAESHEEFLQRQEPTFAVARYVNEQLDDDTVILSQDHRAFYFQKPVVRESIYRRRTSYDLGLFDQKNVARALRGRGFTHVLLAKGHGEGAGDFDATLSELIREHASSRPPLFEHEHRVREGGVIRYRLVEL